MLDITSGFDGSVMAVGVMVYQYDKDILLLKIMQIFFYY